jgi:hypothetical protein
MVLRTKSKNFAVWNERRAGGNKLLTRIKKVKGDAVALANDLKAGLQIPPEHVTVRPTTRHIVVKVRIFYVNLTTASLQI